MASKENTTSELPAFESVQEELEYWKNKCSETQASLQEVEETFVEYRKSSEELEVCVANFNTAKCFTNFSMLMRCLL